MRIPCEICHERQATVHLRKMEGQSEGEMHLCSVCCPLDKSEKEDQETINKFLRGMPRKPRAPLPPIVGEVVAPAHATVLQLASVLSLKPFQIIADLMEIGVFANVNHELDFDTVGKITRKHGYTAKRTA